jgi:hypothetical protein
MFIDAESEQGRLSSGGAQCASNYKPFGSFGALRFLCARFYKHFVPRGLKPQAGVEPSTNCRWWYSKFSGPFFSRLELNYPPTSVGWYFQTATVPRNSIPLRIPFTIIYNALENCFEQIWRGFEDHQSDQARWHRELLDKMFLEIKSLRPGAV